MKEKKGYFMNSIPSHSGCMSIQKNAQCTGEGNQTFYCRKEARVNPIDKEIIRRKLAVIVENLNTLEPIGQITLEKYIEDVYKRKATERLLQELIEAAIDINTHMIVETGHIAPDDYYEKTSRIN